MALVDRRHALGWRGRRRGPRRHLVDNQPLHARDEFGLNFQSSVSAAHAKTPPAPLDRSCSQRLKFATGAQSAEAHAELIGLSPCDAAGAGGPEIIETQFK